jgi:hypothetical protein
VFFLFTSITDTTIVLLYIALMIIPTNRLSYDDVQALISNAEADDTTRLESLELRSVTVLTPDCFAYDYTYTKQVPKPSATLIEKFTSQSADLYTAACSITSSSPVRSKYDINWCSLEDYAANWDLLDKESKITLRLLALSDPANANRFGLKKRNLESHLLLNVGCDMNNITDTGYDSVRSNLKSPDPEASYNGYSQARLPNRTIDPKTCVRAYKKFKKDFDPKALFKLGFVAYQAVITADNSLTSLKNDPHAAKERIHSFFKTNAEFLYKLCNKRRKIMSYVYSHEISVDSILDQKYRPHTHVIFFVQADKYDQASPSESQLAVLELEKAINERFSDRSWSCAKTEIDDSMFPAVAREYADIEKSFEYIHRAYSLADQYMREIRESNINQLNKATVETYRNLIWLFRGEEGAKGCTGVRRLRSSHIPRVDDKKYKHPLLSKPKKTTTIKKEKVKVKKYAGKPISTTKKASASSSSTCGATSGSATSAPCASLASCDQHNQYSEPSTSSFSSKGRRGSRLSRLPQSRALQKSSRTRRGLPIYLRSNRQHHQQC